MPDSGARPADSIGGSTAPAAGPAAGHQPDATVPGAHTVTLPAAPMAEPPAGRPVGRLADRAYRMRRVRERDAAFRSGRQAAVAKATREGWYPLDRRHDPDPGDLMAIRNGVPKVYHTENVNAAISTAAARVRDRYPYNVTGKGLIVGIWDAGHARSTHVEYRDRLLPMDTASVHFHPTHIFGTIGATGIDGDAAGMAPDVVGHSYLWDGDISEMTSRAMASPAETNQLQVSNHSYGHKTGWYLSASPIEWYGAWGNVESDVFGLYSFEAAEWDSICYEAPYYLPVKSAGNDRQDGSPFPGSTFTYYDGGWIQRTYDPDLHPGADYQEGGYDTLPDISNAKNVLTVGAVNDAVNGVNRDLQYATMAPYSGWGPTDDGRIKPDVVANGAGVYSTDSGSDSDYASLSGTSMSAANATGSAMLLVDYYRKLFPGDAILSATLRGLIIHTADDLPPTGPDYRSGWGLMDTRAAAEHLRLSELYPHAHGIHEAALTATNATAALTFTWDRVSPIRVTLCWTDPPGPDQTEWDNRTPVLVNDLDLRLIAPDGSTNLPYALSVTNPSAPAILADNRLDNVEQVLLAEPADTGTYRVTVSHKGDLTDGRQHYSILLSGAAAPPVITFTPPENTSDTIGPYPIEATVQAMSELKPDGVWLYWTTNANGAAFTSNLMVNVSNSHFRAELPGAPLHTAYTYYLYAETSNGLAITHPVDAPVNTHRLVVAPEVDLMVMGSPAALGTVTPDYGMHAFPSGVTVRAWATHVTPEIGGHRYAGIGWVGVNSVPASGSTNELAFVIREDSALVWRWESEHVLAQTSSIPGIVDTRSWWAEGSSATSITAPDTAVIGHDTYRFVEWLIDGQRHPNATAVADNPASGLTMSTGRHATARYLPENEDSDGDGLADWWEYTFFGSLDPTAEDDPDGDGYLNIEEYDDRSDPRDGSSVPSGPVIEHTPLPAVLGTPAPWDVTALITDNHVVRDVTLRWRRNGLNWRRIPMTPTAGVTNQYGVAIPAPGLMDDTFEYIIEASDAAGYFVEDGPHTSFVAFPVQTTSPGGFAFVLLPGESTNVVLSIQNSGNTNLDWRIELGRVGFHDDMESGTSAWHHSGTYDPWHLSDKRAFSGSNAWYCGDEATSSYPDSANASLMTHPVLLASDSTLSFRHWIRTELDSATHAWDGAVVEISVDGGETFEFITPEGGYPYRIVSNPASPFAPNTPCFAGTGAWEHVVCDLSAYGGEEAILRFRLGADAFVVDEGWYVDDVTISPDSKTNEWLTLSAFSGQLPATHGTQVDLAAVTTDLPVPFNDDYVLRVIGNDPAKPVDLMAISLKVKTRPQLTLTFAGQTSRQGEGLVTVSNEVADVDLDTCSIELLYSLDGGQTWHDAWVSGSESHLGIAAIDNETPPQVTGILTSNVVGAITNLVSVEWSTTNAAGPIVLATHVLVRSRAWDGHYWSGAVTSEPFVVDNEAPAMPPALSVSSHDVEIWSSNGTVQCEWTAAHDYDGVGISGYHLGIGVPAAATTRFTPATTAQRDTPADGSNLWVSVQASDLFGNLSPARQLGPFKVDTTPPAANWAKFEFDTHPFGYYIMGTNITCSWNGFVDASSGIEGYYAALTDAGGTTNGVWTASPGLTLTGAVPDQANVVYVWAMDAVGNVGLSAAAPILVLSDDEDYDGDGHANAHEAIAGTDASDASSAFEVREVITLQGTNVSEIVVTWDAITNRIYGVTCATNLLGPDWRPLPGYTNLPGVAGTMSYTGVIDRLENRFYRATVEMP